ncbi:hypothetical protein Q1695_000828 [Nippostrongylus brasiliensis]|nr:hypothetical protein Q1695_000828 [Nippostrongylus brasiliensis]
MIFYYALGNVARGSGLGLTIHSVNVDDAGRYHCVVTRFAKQPTRPETGPPIRLIVNASPTLLSPTNHDVKYGTIGQPFSVECESDGVPPPEITWLQNEKIVSAGPVLRIDKLESVHEGTYTCLAVNVEGRATSQIDLKFSRTPTFDFVPTNKTVIEGSNLFWRCHADAKPSGIQYSWTFHDRPIKTTETGLRVLIKDGDLSLRDVRKHDRGWYTCSASSPSGEQSHASAFLDVFYAPEPIPLQRQVLTIGYGQSGALTCSVDGNPAPSLYTWSKNGHFVATSTEDTLSIRGEKESDGGIFGCQAENSIGRSPVIETHVIIAEPPAFISRPPPELRAFEGASLNVTCEGFGDPLPIVYWVHSERRISSATLSFSTVSHGDHGVYECVVSNAVATITSTMRLLVERTRPQAATIDRVECVGEEAMSIHWTPGFNGSYAQSFVVYYVSEEDSTEKSLLTTFTTATVADLTPFSKYRIHIESRNQKGSTNSSAVEKYVCSTLPTPSNVRLVDDTELMWDPVEHARSYRVESRSDKMSTYREIGEVLDPSFRVRSDLHHGLSLRVRSLRTPYEPSSPSRSIEFGTYDANLPSMWWAVFGGFLFFVTFLTLYLFSKYGRYVGGRKKRNKHYNDYVRPSPFQPQTETFYEPSLNMTDSGKARHWQETTEGSIVQTQSEDLMEYGYGEESASAVDDMLRDKYMYGAEEVPVQLMNDLRIERLRREFKQSQL